MKQLDLSAPKTIKRFISGAAATALGSAFGLGLLPGFGTGSALAGSTHCSSPWAEQAIDYLQERTGYMPPFFFCYEIDSGMTYTDYITFDELDLNMSENHAFVAECDTDCADLDLRVYDPTGNHVGADVSTDSYAEVYVPDVEVGETYQVEITMYDCDASFCGAVLGTTPRQ